MFRRFINKWKQPIYKHDVLIVLLFGFISALVFGIIGGAIDYLFIKYDINISLSIVILALGISYILKTRYASYHILYPTLAALFLVLGLFISDLTLVIFSFQNLKLIFSTLSNYAFYLGFLLSPFVNLISFISGLVHGTFLLEALLYAFLDIVTYSFAFYFVTRNTIGRN